MTSLVDKVDMSLDDIIKQSKQFKIGPRRGGRTGGGRPGGAQRGGNKGTQRGGLAGGPMRNRRSFGGLRTGSYSKGDINGRWQHDLYDNSFTRRVGGPSVGGISLGPSKILISNLDFGVSNTDVQELFAEFGPLKSATVHYDKSGRSLGTAEVVFDRRSDAIKALKQYNGVPLDGRPMNIQLATSDITALQGRRVGVSGGITKPRQGGRPNRAPRGRGGAGGSNFRRGGGGRNRRGPQPTAEQLDAELDAYVAKAK